MDRRTFLSTAGALLVKVLPANAQPAKKVPRIGVLHTSPAASVSQYVEASFLPLPLRRPSILIPRPPPLRLRITHAWAVR